MDNEYYGENKFLRNEIKNETEDCKKSFSQKKEILDKKSFERSIDDADNDYNDRY